MRSIDRVLKSSFILCSIVWLLLDVIPGRLVQYDEVFFKAAGLHWANSGRFIAPEVVGRLDVQPGLDVIYFAQPPIYTFLFGLYIKLIGFGPHQCILFDCIIHILLACLTILLARRLFRVPAVYAYAAGFLILPLGTSGRPDELATSFAILGFLAWTLEISPLYRAILAGILFGVCGATSVGACLFLAPLAFLIAYQKHLLTFKTLAASLVVGAVVGVACVSPILITHPDAVHQLLSHASDQSPQMGASVGTGQSRLKSMLLAYELGTKSAVRYGSHIVFPLLGALIAIALLFRGEPRNSARLHGQQYAVAVAAMAFIWFMLPGKYTYLWFFGPWLFALTAAMLAQSAQQRPRLFNRRLALAVLAVFAAVGVGEYARNKLIILTLPSQQAFDTNMAHIRAVIPAGSRVISSQYWWALADKCSVYDANFSLLKPLKVDYLIKDGNGSGHPGQPVPFRPEYEEDERQQHFAVLENDLNRVPLIVGGVHVTHGAYGFGPLVLTSH